MRRVVIIFAAASMLLAIGPAGALARHNHRGRHHTHARLERFGADPSTTQGTSGNQSSTSSSDNAGIVQSFSNGVLTIALTDASGNPTGNTVSGTVNNDTEIECNSSSSSQSTHMDGDGGGGGDNQSGDGGQNSGSNDQGDSSEQSGNDNGNENEDQGGSSCSSSNLTPNTVVREAELRVSSGGSVWKKVELAS